MKMNNVCIWLWLLIGTAVNVGAQSNIVVDSTVDYSDLNGSALSEIKFSGVNGALLFLENVEFDGKGEVPHRMVVSSNQTGRIKLANSVLMTIFNENAGTNYGGAFFIENTAVLNMQTVGDVAGFNFISNSASVGGAIHNSGEFSVSNATFTENMSTTNWGGAIQNSGIFELSNGTFSKNSSVGVGGAIGNNGTMRLTNVTFAENHGIIGSGGAIWSQGDLYIAQAEFVKNKSHFGGALRNKQMVELSDAVFSYNSSTSSSGGAFANVGTALVENVKFEGNYSESHGAAILNEGNSIMLLNHGDFLSNTGKYSGAIYNAGAMNISNGWFYANTASNGGAVYNYGTNALMTLTNISFLNNIALNHGGSIYNFNGNLTLSTGIFKNNSAGSGGAMRNVGGILQADECSFSDNSASSGGAINNTYLHYHSTLVTNGITNLVTRDLFLGKISITNSVFLNNKATGNGGAVYNINTFEMSDGEFRNNQANAGGAIYNSGGTVYNNIFSGDTTLTNVSFFKNAANSGGAVYNTDIFEITGGEFINNSANNGGVFYNSRQFYTSNDIIDNVTNRIVTGISSGQVLLKDVIFKANSASNSGGVGYNFGTFNITNGTFLSNTASNGGVFYNMSTYSSYYQVTNGVSNRVVLGISTGTINAADVTFKENSALNSGGVIYNTGILNITNGVFSLNTSSHGGGFYNSSTVLNYSTVDDGITNRTVIGMVTGVVNLVDAVFEKNSVSNYGGAVRNQGIFNVINGTFSSNSARYGGAFYNNHLTSSYNQIIDDVTNRIVLGEFQGIANLENASFSDNTATYGGAIYNADIFNITDGLFSNNQSSNGSAIYNTGTNAIMHLSKVVFSNNVASGFGGTIYNSGTLSLFNSIFISNSAAVQGGAIYSSSNLQLTVTSGETAVFLGNHDSFGANSIYFQRGTFLVTVESGGILDMQDPMRSTSGSDFCTITKNGAGIWKLGGNNSLRRGDFNINSGILELYAGARLDVSNLNLQAGGTIAVNYPAQIHISYGFQGGGLIDLIGFPEGETNLLITAGTSSIAASIADALHFSDTNVNSMAVGTNVYVTSNARIDSIPSFGNQLLSIIGSDGVVKQIVFIRSDTNAVAIDFEEEDNDWEYILSGQFSYVAQENSGIFSITATVPNFDMITNAVYHLQFTNETSGTVNYEFYSSVFGSMTDTNTNAERFILETLTAAAPSSLVNKKLLCADFDDDSVVIEFFADNTFRAVESDGDVDTGVYQYSVPFPTNAPYWASLVTISGGERDEFDLYMLTDRRGFIVEFDPESGYCMNTCEFTLVVPATTNAPVDVPYAWLDAHGLVTGSNYEAAAMADVDGNGVLNWQEYVAGTNPTNAASRFLVMIDFDSSGNPVISWTPDLTPDRIYTIEGRETLTNEWGATNVNSRFFRVKVSLPEN